MWNSMSESMVFYGIRDQWAAEMSVVTTSTRARISGAWSEKDEVSGSDPVSVSMVGNTAVIWIWEPVASIVLNSLAEK